ILYREFSMTKQSWIRNLLARPATRPTRNRPHRSRPVLEALEDRTVPSTFYVNVNAPFPGPGDSWQTAFNNLQTALNVAGSSGSGEVWVARGSYTSTSGFILPANVAGYGGFFGVETSLAQRNWVGNMTTLTRVGGSGNVVFDPNPGDRLDGF